MLLPELGDTSAGKGTEIGKKVQRSGRSGAWQSDVATRPVVSEAVREGIESGDAGTGDAVNSIVLSAGSSTFGDAPSAPRGKRAKRRDC